MTGHRPGVNPGYLIKHTLSLVATPQADVSGMVAELDHIPGVDEVEFDAGSKTLRLAYDASHHDIDEMIGIIERHGADVKSNWWSRKRLGWQRQTDQTIRENATHVPHCCNKVPSGLDRKH